MTLNQACSKVRLNWPVQCKSVIQLFLQLVGWSVGQKFWLNKRSKQISGYRFRILLKTFLSLHGYVKNTVYLSK